MTKLNKDYLSYKYQALAAGDIVMTEREWQKNGCPTHAQSVQASMDWIPCEFDTIVYIDEFLPRV